jgi:hypothetical protein
MLHVLKKNKKSFGKIDREGMKLYIYYNKEGNNRQ